jgi:prepilin-type N-terminal cleavage/methylation domain-containing protein
MRRKGFTLIELLVVVAIMVILAGILYPVFAATRRAAYSAGCISNLKQIGLAVQMYTQDYDEAFPTACNQIDRHSFIRKAQPNWPTPTPYLWEAVAPYIKNPGIWRCQADTGFTVGGAPVSFKPNAFELSGSSYNYNTDLVWLHTGDKEADQWERIGRWVPLTIGAVQNPTETWISAEPTGAWHNSIRGADTRHTYHYNHVFVDGHAKSMTQAWVEVVWARDRSAF